MPGKKTESSVGRVCAHSCEHAEPRAAALDVQRHTHIHFSSYNVLMMDGHEVNNNVKGVREGVVVTGEEEWLCVSRLPTDVHDDEFYDMLAEFGNVKESFLVNSSQPGERMECERNQ